MWLCFFGQIQLLLMASLLNSAFKCWALWEEAMSWSQRAWTVHHSPLCCCPGKQRASLRVALRDPGASGVWFTEFPAGVKRGGNWSLAWIRRFMEYRIYQWPLSFSVIGSEHMLEKIEREESSRQVRQRFIMLLAWVQMTICTQFRVCREKRAVWE